MHCPRRRTFLWAGAALAAAPRATLASAASAAAEPLSRQKLSQLHKAYRAELFDRVLPFWDRHGIDHRRGGFMCALDYDGSRRNTDKFHWYQGRGIWVYSYLYNHFGKDPRHLAVARKTSEFWLRHGREKNGWWSERLSRDGQVLQPFRGDVYSAFTTAEGLHEFAIASGEEAARERAIRLVKRAFQHVTQPTYRDPYAAQAGWRVQGIWIYTLNSCTQMLRHRDDPALARMADDCLEAILDKHHNPDIGLNNEFLHYDFSRPRSEASKCLIGHSIQALWHVMDEGLRRKNESLLRRAAARVRRHLQIGWDHVYGGLCEWVNVNATDHVWGPQKLGDQKIDLRMRGEYNYVKSFWALNEVLVATLLAYEQLRESWAADYFLWAQDVLEKKFSRWKKKQATYLLATDRQMRFVPRSVRQDNYHPLRRMMRNLQVLARLRLTASDQRRGNR